MFTATFAWDGFPRTETASFLREAERQAESCPDDLKSTGVTLPYLYQISRIPVKRNLRTTEVAEYRAELRSQGITAPIIIPVSMRADNVGLRACRVPRELAGIVTLVIKCLATFVLGRGLGGIPQQT